MAPITPMYGVGPLPLLDPLLPLLPPELPPEELPPEELPPPLLPPEELPPPLLLPEPLLPELPTELLLPLEVPWSPPPFGLEDDEHAPSDA